MWYIWKHATLKTSCENGSRLKIVGGLTRREAVVVMMGKWAWEGASFWGQPCETHKKRDCVFESRLVMWFTIPFLRRYRVLPWKTKLLLWRLRRRKCRVRDGERKIKLKWFGSAPGWLIWSRIFYSAWKVCGIENCKCWMWNEWEHVK